MTKTLLAAISAGVLTLIAPAVAAAVPPRAHPPITDAAGDAPDPRGVNVAGADLLSADLTLEGRVLTATVTTGASAAGGSGPSTHDDHAPYSMMGVLADPDGETASIRITLNPHGLAAVTTDGQSLREAYTTSSDGVTQASFTVPRGAVPGLAQGITQRTRATGMFASARVRTIYGKAVDRTGEADFTLGG